MSRKTKEPLYRLACYIRRQMELSVGQPTELSRQIALLAQTCRSVADCWESCAIARKRGWPHAAERRLLALTSQLPTLYSLASTAAHWPDRPPRTIPSIQELIADLKQLHAEFDQVEIDPRAKRITATTPRIVLKGMDLGPFAIELKLNDLADHPNSASFRCIAVEPNTPAGDDDVTHPHVSGGQLCAGDASSPIASALAQGRLCDAFLLVQSVLQTYNAGNVYVSLDRWEGQSCPDCDYTMMSGESCYCDLCNRDVCDECMGRCEGCANHFCRRCLEEDPITEQSYCSACRETCAECDAIVGQDRFDSQTLLCATCLRERREREAVQEKLAPSLVPEQTT